MAKFEDFAREIRTISFAPGTTGGEIVAEELATFARAELARTIQSGEGSAVYDLFVNSRPAASEFEVEVPGPIVYVFSWWGEIIATALAELIKRSPKRSGQYAASFIVLVNGVEVAPGTAISDASEVIITNVQPYARKIEVGGMKMSARPRMFEATRRVMQRRFGRVEDGFSFQVKFLDLPRGIHPLVPYILKGHERSTSRAALSTWHQVPTAVIDMWRAQGKNLGSVNMLRRQAAQNRKSSAFREGRTFLSGRRSVAAGERLTYPALVMNLAN